MKKSILKSLEPKTKTLFRFNNSVKKASFGPNPTHDTSNTSDPTTATIMTTSYIF